MKRQQVIDFLAEHPDAEIVQTDHRSCEQGPTVALHLGHDWKNFDIRTFNWLYPALEQAHSVSGGEMHFVYRLKKDQTMIPVAAVADGKNAKK